MIWHATNGIDFLLVVVYNTADVFTEFVFPRLMNEILPSFYRKNDVNVKLGVCVCHVVMMLLKVMSPLRGYDCFVMFSSIEMSPLRGYDCIAMFSFIVISSLLDFENTNSLKM